MFPRVICKSMIAVRVHVQLCVHVSSRHSGGEVTPCSVQCTQLTCMHVCVLACVYTVWGFSFYDTHMKVSTKMVREKYLQCYISYRITTKVWFVWLSRWIYILKTVVCEMSGSQSGVRGSLGVLEGVPYSFHYNLFISNTILQTVWLFWSLVSYAFL